MIDCFIKNHQSLALPPCHKQPYYMHNEQKSILLHHKIFESNP
ncbi:hypothetical protein SPBRAN_1594 [uncultured Candidatus Thioglobus sp.]|nr:hypothetical protein SPBRAN_1594 [uncultured Candidatus Thioglobus sp.]